MSVSLVTYKGLAIISPDPIGDAGLALNNNIKAIADSLFTQGPFVRTLSRVTTTPPSSPTDGAAYIVPSAATGAWSGFYNKIAYAYSGAWYFMSPLEGWYADVADEKALYRYSTTAGNWIVMVRATA